MKLVVICPERTLVDCEVDHVELPGTQGRFVVLKDHAPMVSSLEPGEIIYCTGGNESASVSISSGFVEIRDNQVTACIEQ